MGLLRIRYQHEAGQKLGVVVERVADGQFFDPGPAPNANANGNAAGSFGPTPPATLIPLTPAGPGVWGLVYRGQVDSTGWADGTYAIYLLSGVGMIVGSIGVATIRGGDDAPYFPTFPKQFEVVVAG